MKRIYFLMLAAVLTTLMYGQTVNIVADSHEGDVSTAPDQIIANSQFMVYAGKGVHSWTTNFTYYDTEVWVTDGSAANTRMLEINPTWKWVESTTYGDHREDLSAQFTDAILFNDKVYFSAKNGDSDNAHVYYIDGITGDTVRALNKAWTSRVVADNANGKVYLTQSGSEPWKVWDGVNLNNPVELPNQFQDVGGVPTLIVNNTGSAYLLGSKIIFGGTYVDVTLDDATGTELFVYDLNGTDGPVLLKDVRAGASNSSPNKYAELNNMVYFVCNDGASNRLWRTDGIPGGTTEKVVVSINGSDDWTVDVLTQPFAFNGKLYFEGDDDDSASEAYDQLYEYDPATNTLTRISGLQDAYKLTLDPVEEVFINFDPGSYVVLDNTLYFIGVYSFTEEGKTYDSTTKAIYKLNGSSVEIIPESIGFYPSELLVFDNKIYFNGEDLEYIDNGDGTFTSSGEELFVFDPNGSSTAIAPVHNQNNIDVFPNPSTGYVNVSGLKGANASYELYDLSGQLVEKGLVNDNVIDYNVSKGVYLLKVSNKEMTKTIKLVVK